MSGFPAGAGITVSGKVAWLDIGTAGGRGVECKICLSVNTGAGKQDEQVEGTAA